MHLDITGDGAAKNFGARGVGIDINPVRIGEAKENARKAAVESLVRFEENDPFAADIREASGKRTPVGARAGRLSSHVILLAVNSPTSCSTIPARASAKCTLPTATAI